MSPRLVQSTSLRLPPVGFYNSVAVIRRLLLGSPQATKTLQLINQSFIPSCETWAGAVVRFSRPRSTLAPSGSTSVTEYNFTECRLGLGDMTTPPSTAERFRRAGGAAATTRTSGEAGPGESGEHATATAVCQGRLLSQWTRLRTAYSVSKSSNLRKVRRRTCHHTRC